MPISFKSLLKEDPDDLYYSDSISNHHLEHTDDNTIGIFSVFMFEDRKVTIAMDNRSRNIFIDDPIVEQKYKDFNNGDLKFHRQNFYHHYLHRPLEEAGIVKDEDRDSDEFLVSARIWKIYDGDFAGKFLCSFWQTYRTVKMNDTHVENAFVLLNIDIKNCMFEFLDKQGELVTFDQSFVKNDIGTTKSLSTKQIKALQQIQHFSPEAKKALLTQHPPNRLQLAADKLGVTYAQLRHILTGPEMIGKKSFEENLDIDSFLDDDKLSFGDYFSPTIPYDVKPVPSLKPME